MYSKYYIVFKTNLLKTLVAKKTILNEILQSEIITHIITHITPPVPTLPHLGGVMWVENTQKVKPIPASQIAAHEK